jgi:hypothetical protein
MSNKDRERRNDTPGTVEAAIIAAGLTPITPTEPTKTTEDADAPTLDIGEDLSLVPAGQRVIAGTKERPNRYDQVFGAVTMKAIDKQSKTYDNSDGSKSRKIATVTVEIGTSGTVLRGTIYAKRSARGRTTAEFSFMGTTGQSSVSTLTPEAKADMEHYKLAVARRGAEWAEQNKAALAAQSESNSPELKGFDAF